MGGWLRPQGVQASFLGAVCVDKGGPIVCDPTWQLEVLEVCAVGGSVDDGGVF
jgi:hypothetical protein